MAEERTTDSDAANEENISEFGETEEKTHEKSWSEIRTLLLRIPRDDQA